MANLKERIEWKHKELDRAESLLSRVFNGEDVRLRPGRSAKDLDRDVLKLRRELKSLKKRYEKRKG